MTDRLVLKPVRDCLRLRLACGKQRWVRQRNLAKLQRFAGVAAS